MSYEDAAFINTVITSAKMNNYRNLIISKKENSLMLFAYGASRQFKITVVLKQCTFHEIPDFGACWSAVYPFIFRPDVVQVCKIS